ncbi:retrotransposon protein [Cucumis melo var. makuwa]|uniref:Retrotransposon protein n=1 Tax=Cucumis melo var. makuwa TaxID=1194695 RepID=A0A5A7U005_CUCMM|nr:retrotransposon protein [Cucumis melo var. makuwa]
MSTSNRVPRHVWTNEEDSTLVECLMKLVSMGNGNRIMVRFSQVTTPSWPSPKCGGQPTVALSETMKRNVSLRRKNYLIIQLGEGTPNKPFLYYVELTYVFDRDRVTGRFAETFVDVGSNEPGGYDGFDMGDGNEKFPPMTGSSGSKRKRGNQRKVDVEGIHLALDQTNEQLRMIAEWPVHALGNDNHVRTEFFRILREMPELTSLDNALLQRHLLSHMDDLRGFILMPEDEREGFCRVLSYETSRDSLCLYRPELLLICLLFFSV